MERREAGHEVSNTAMLLVLGFAMLGIAYKLGERAAAPPLEQLQALTEEEQRLQAWHKACVEDLNTYGGLSQLSTDEQKLLDVTKKSDQSVLAEVEAMQELRDVYEDCKLELEELELEVGGVADLRKSSAELNKQCTDLTESLAQMPNSTNAQAKGTEALVLTALLNRMAELHTQLQLKYEGKVVVVDETYLERVGNEFMEHAHNDRTQSAEWHKTMKSILPPTDRELELMRANGSILLQGEETYFASAYNPENDTWVQPTWKDQTGNRPLTRGVLSASEAAKRLAPTTLSRKLLRLYDYALCARFHDVDTLAFPTSFVWEANGTVEKLHTMVATPYVSFCENCAATSDATFFRGLCHGSFAEDLYGTARFWLVRSKIVPSDSIRRAAKKFIEEHELETGRTLAVRLPRGRQWEALCTAVPPPEPLLFYKTILSEHLPEDRVLGVGTSRQCHPLWEDFITEVRKLISTLKVKKLFLVSDVTQDSTIVDQLEMDFGVDIAYIEPSDEMTAAENALTQIVVASKMPLIVVNRFDPMSAHITEYFLLNNRLDFQNIWVW